MAPSLSARPRRARSRSRRPGVARGGAPGRGRALDANPNTGLRPGPARATESAVRPMPTPAAARPDVPAREATSRPAGCYRLATEEFDQLGDDLIRGFLHQPA